MGADRSFSSFILTSTIATIDSILKSHQTRYYQDYASMQLVIQLERIVRIINRLWTKEINE